MKQFFFRISLICFILATPAFLEAKTVFIVQDSIVSDSIENNVFLLKHEYKELTRMKLVAILSFAFLIVSAIIIILFADFFMLWAASAGIALLLSLTTIGKTRKYRNILKNMEEDNPDYDLVKSSVTWSRIARFGVFFPILFLVLLFFIFESFNVELPATTLVAGFSVIGFAIGNYFLLKD